MGSPVAVDEWTAWAIGAIELPDESEVSRWYMVLAEAAEDTVDWEPLGERIRAGAEQASFDPNAVESFLRSMADTGQGAELVHRLVALGDQLPSLYFALRAQPIGEAASADPFGWLRPEHRNQLSSMWGDGWTDLLRQQLDHRWGPGWEARPGEHKTSWFEDLIGHLTEPEPTTAEPAEPGPAEEHLSSALTAAVATVPGAADLTEQELAEVMAEVRARLQSAPKETTS